MKTPRRGSARPPIVRFRIRIGIVIAAILCPSLGTLSRTSDARQDPAVQSIGQDTPQHHQATASSTPSQAYDGGSPLDEKSGFWVTGQKGELPRSALYADATGALGIVNLSGPINTLGHPFFTPLGTNGRACVTCHQPGNGMSISTATLQRRWVETSGRDPVFAAVDGANCPDLPQGQASSHTLLLQHGLFRIYLPWPPRAADGSSMNPEFAIQVVRDPTGCNTSTKYGLKSSNSMISVFRRPRPIANMKYPMSPFGLWSPKTGEVLPIDPETKKRENLNILADNRQPSLEAQAVDAAFSHEQATDKPSRETLQHLVAFEMQIYAAQSVDSRGGSLTTGAIKAGPQALIDGMPAMLADYNGGSFPELDGWLTSTAVSSQRWDRNTVRPDFPAMREGAEKETPVETAFRDSVARGYEMFRSRDILIRNVSNYNTIGLGNPYKQPCANCHNMQRTGMDSSPGFMDLGTTNLPTADPLPWLPLFKVTCKASATPHPFLGRVIYTHDPGRALITGRCVDVGSINMQQFRGLAARAPYFSNGSAKTLRDIVVFYNRRFDMKYSERDIQDMVNFLSVL